MFFKCQRRHSWETFTMTLQVALLLSKAGSCDVTSEEVQLYQALSGVSVFSIGAPMLYTPSLPAVNSTSGQEVLRKRLEMKVTEICQLATAILSHRIEADTDTLIQLHSSRIQHTLLTECVATEMIVAGAVLFLLTLYYFFQPPNW
jgi:hypothetical protein